MSLRIVPPPPFLKKKNFPQVLSSVLCTITVLSFEVMTHNVSVPYCKARFVCGPAHTRLD